MVCSQPDMPGAGSSVTRHHWFRILLAGKYRVIESMRNEDPLSCPGELLVNSWISLRNIKRGPWDRVCNGLIHHGLMVRWRWTFRYKISLLLVWPGCRRTCRPCRSWRPAWHRQRHTCRPHPAPPCHCSRRDSGSGSCSWPEESSELSYVSIPCCWDWTQISSESPSFQCDWAGTAASVSCYCVHRSVTPGAVMPSPLQWQPIRCRGYKNECLLLKLFIQQCNM